MKKLALFIISFLFINSLFALNNNDKKQFISYGIGYDSYIQNIVDEHSPRLCLDGLSFVTKEEKIFNNYHEILLSYVTMNFITVPWDVFVSDINYPKINFSLSDNLSTGVSLTFSSISGIGAYTEVGLHANTILLFTDYFTKFSTDIGFGMMVGFIAPINPTTQIDFGCTANLDIIGLAITNTNGIINSEFIHNKFGKGMSFYALLSY